MTVPDGEGSGTWMRPYTVTNGRTHPTTALQLISMVRTTGRVPPERLGGEHARALQLCHFPTSVAEVAAHLRQPVAITKVLLSDLIDSGAVTTRAPSATAHSTDLLEKVLDGLRQRL
ncbi:uncharacterized protein DUF742 [Halopolyspora algeriensis]|uniref:Uncharacterized protein DUF742 n=1 Tax=Halopolyspora algeriensis TaxID=1500506 RepID=A0A368VES6_9ACTN|nr:DUF742 domain-containing protein [Halopolyspora algeriensis]RCW39699.1 uncharacterized protein DUF742 [Halopolyspora algeriensis]TQM54008.1 uncharacterized protein DUF742 [Halopolyspora algeriensis]